MIGAISAARVSELVHLISFRPDEAAGRFRRDASFFIDRDAAEDGLANRAAELSADVGADAMALMELRGVERPGNVGIDQDKVGVVAGFDASLIGDAETARGFGGEKRCEPRGI